MQRRALIFRSDASPRLRNQRMPSLPVIIFIETSKTTIILLADRMLICAFISFFFLYKAYMHTQIYIHTRSVLQDRHDGHCGAIASQSDQAKTAMWDSLVWGKLSDTADSSTAPQSRPCCGTNFITAFRIPPKTSPSYLIHSASYDSSTPSQNSQMLIVM
jgi:hypothetical protein